MNSKYIVNAGAADFHEKAIAASYEQPVLVDFWAQWCGPCRSLAPVLEQLAQELQGKLRIVKVDSDAEPELAARYGVRSLPTLILFRAGEVQTQMSGAQPLGALKEALAPHLPRAGDGTLTEVRSLMEQARFAEVIMALSQAIEQDPEDYRLHPVLAEAYIEAGEADNAREVLGTLPVNVAAEDEPQRVEARLRLLEAATTDSDDPLENAYAKASKLAARSEYPEALEKLLNILEQDKNWRDGAARKAMLDIFTQLPAGSRELREYRGRLARTLN